jgi:hypothetical protein
MTEREKLIADKFETLITENDLSKDFLVSIIKLAMSSGKIGSAEYQAQEEGYNSIYVRRAFKRQTINGINFFYQEKQSL